MDLGLAGRVALVSGGSKGIGRAVARALAAEGARVVVSARGADALASAEQEIRRAGGEVLAVPADVRDPEGVSHVAERAVEAFGGLDILVNNVGGAGTYGGFFDLADEAWIEAYRLNVMSVVYFVRYALPWLRQSAAPRIVNVASISGVEPGSFNPHYTVANAGVINLTKHLANQFAGERILVNVVCPGPVHSHSWDQNVRRVAEVRGLSVDEARAAVDAEEAAKIPLGRIGEGDDVAAVVAFLASDRAAWITGSCFHVNGGKLRSM